VWRSLVARFVRDEEVAGSNPVTPTRAKAWGVPPGLWSCFGMSQQDLGVSRRWRRSGSCHPDASKGLGCAPGPLVVFRYVTAGAASRLRHYAVVRPVCKRTSSRRKVALLRLAPGTGVDDRLAIRVQAEGSMHGAQRPLSVPGTGDHGDSNL
jgi:hypothetical protein